MIKPKKKKVTVSSDGKSLTKTTRYGSVTVPTGTKKQVRKSIKAGKKVVKTAFKTIKKSNKNPFKATFFKG